MGAVSKSVIALLEAECELRDRNDNTFGEFLPLWSFEASSFDTIKLQDEWDDAMPGPGYRLVHRENPRNIQSVEAPDLILRTIRTEEVACMLELCKCTEVAQ